MTIVTRRSALGALGALAATAALPGGIATALAQGSKIKPGPTDALIVTDIQKCFLPGGTLAVAKGDEIVPLVNAVAKRFQIVIITQDWHTPKHISFASSHSGKKPFETVQLDYGTQVLWPDHCIQGTEDAELAPGLSIAHAQLVIRKGHNQKVDSYSTFIEADGKTKTGLDGYFRSRGVTSVYLCGLATDFCVAWSALDARKLGFDAIVIEDLCRGIDTQGSLAKAWAAMNAAGVKRIDSSAIA